ncbi:hypothetical protein BASA81_004661 [Batrachochytrium salamandrivorans]|nr:hypothetical protein BASA62_001698 [Batrachochytrium salamandrivorans]KAH9257111.1 hypothetical protein BASA81_004661 [Batrachochytrium salamandrivorans]
MLAVRGRRYLQCDQLWRTAVRPAIPGLRCAGQAQSDVLLQTTAARQFSSGHPLRKTAAQDPTSNATPKPHSIPTHPIVDISSIISQTTKAASLKPRRQSAVDTLISSFGSDPKSSKYPLRERASYQNLVRALERNQNRIAYGIFSDLQHNSPDQLRPAGPELYETIISLLSDSASNVIPGSLFVDRALRVNSIYTFMWAAGVPPLASTFEKILRMNSRLDHRSIIKQVHSHIERLGLMDQLSIEGYASFVRGYMGIGDEATAVSHFQTLCKRTNTTFPYNVLISSYSHTKQEDKMLSVIKAMKESEAMKPDMNCYLQVVLHYFRAEKYDRMKQTITEYIDGGGSPCEPLLFAQMLHANSVGKSHEGLRALVSFRGAGIKITSRIVLEELIGLAGCKYLEPMWAAYAKTKVEVAQETKRVAIAMATAIGPLKPPEADTVSSPSLDAVEFEINRRSLRPSEVYPLLLSGYASLKDLTSVEALVEVIFRHRIGWRPSLIADTLNTYAAVGDFEGALSFITKLAARKTRAPYRAVLRVATQIDPTFSPQHAAISDKFSTFMTLHHPDQHMRRTHQASMTKSLSASAQSTPGMDSTHSTSELTEDIEHHTQSLPV